MLKLNTNNTLKLIGKLFSFPKAELPHCTSIKQWGSGTANKNGASYGGVSATLPIKINNMLLCVGNMSGSAACLMNVGFNAEKNTISGSWDSFQYNTPNPSTWRYFVIGN